MVASSIPKIRISEGLPHPLGATWDGLGVNFALFSANATKVELCLFDGEGRQELAAHRTAGIHRRGLARLPARRAARARSMATACTAPTSRRPGTASIRNKLLLDPYAQGAGRRTDAGTRRCSATRSESRATTSPSTSRDSAAFMPKCRVIDPAFTWGRDQPAAHPWERTIFYETHVRGYTMRHPGGAGGAARHLRRPGASRR